MKEIRKVLYETFSISLNAEQVQHLAHSVDSEFDLSELTGFSSQAVIPRQVAVDACLNNFKEDKPLMAFVARCLASDGQYVAGAQLSIKGRASLLGYLGSRGWIFDEVRGSLRREQEGVLTPDWGYLLDGTEYSFALASFDVVGSSVLPLTNAHSDIERTLDRLHDFVEEKINVRDGRLWQWHGDGGLAAFTDHYATERCAISMVDVLCNLPLFNVLHSVLAPSSDLKLRIGMHFARLPFREDPNRLNHAEIDTVTEIQEHAPPNHISVTNSLYNLLPNEVKKTFVPGEAFHHHRTYVYRVI